MATTFFTLLVASFVFTSSASLQLRGSILQPRIFNGQMATLGQFSYQVGLNSTFDGKTFYWCGGALISPEWILTAAHCIDGFKNITTYLGSTLRQGGLAIRPIESIVHPKWNRTNLLNDIALLRIPAVQMGPLIHPIQLPAIASSYATYENHEAIVSGWGQTGDSGNTSPSLQYADLTIVSKYVCDYFYDHSKIQGTHICLASSDDIATCNGDSGGPVVLKSSRTLVGVVSFGPSVGCTKGYPAVGTRITTFRQWIKENVNV